MPKRRQSNRSDKILMIAAVIFILIAGFALNKHAANVKEAERQEQQARKAQAAARKQSAKKAAAAKAAAAKIVDWQKPSQTYAYPEVTADNPVVLTVSLKKQRVTITQNDKHVYTMYCSTGVDDSTPHGNFHIIERGKSFYNPKEKMGANYWTSFLGTTYLFHSVPTDHDGNYILSETKTLGKKPSSHGCIRLSVPDAKWINEHVPSGTKVVIA